MPDARCKFWGMGPRVMAGNVGLPGQMNTRLSPEGIAASRSALEALEFQASPTPITPEPGHQHFQIQPFEQPLPLNPAAWVPADHI